MGVRTSAVGWTELYIIFDIDPSVLEPLLARVVGGFAALRKRNNFDLLPG